MLFLNTCVYAFAVFAASFLLVQLFKRIKGDLDTAIDFGPGTLVFLFFSAIALLAGAHLHHDHLRLLLIAGAVAAFFGGGYGLL